MFYTQGCPVWDVSAVPVAMLLVATLMNAFMIPATPGAEIRGVGEMYPLNGPAWSLFFEYIGNVLYALFIRRLSTRALAVLVAAAGCGLAAFSVWGAAGDICVGFSLTGENIVGGSLRLLFAFPAGLLLSRAFRPVRVRRGVLDRHAGRRRPRVRAADRRKRTPVDERRVRRFVRRRPLPADRLDRGFRERPRTA